MRILIFILALALLFFGCFIIMLCIFTAGGVKIEGLEWWQEFIKDKNENNESSE